MERQIKYKTGRAQRGRQKGPAVLCWRLWPEACSAPSWSSAGLAGGCARGCGELWGPQSPRAPARASPGPRDRAAPVAIAAVRARAPVPSEQTRPRRPAAQHAHHGGESGRLLGGGCGVGAGTLEQATPGIPQVPLAGRPVRGCAGSGVTIGSGRAGRGFGVCCSSCWESVRLD